ncbi:NAD-dependent dehydratase [Mucilaginibacter sp. PPCGB 2223]|uniref:NAD(P)H-binding protein n=1 Tax=Mucilaginibacter sp. PPCGB 2223 TaxID=1886027 RepID=UPI000825305F|nr:NAD(P)H-binding protein [Mucilaginibacter sp. PPCGB 2223]OCX50500.1 NAD-dependent dehydratase [Mucilaginibacter sp. PPCGB 2223]
MKITTTGSLGNVAKPLVQKLIAAGHEVTVISTKADKTSEIEALGAKAVIGSISDAAFLTEAFKGADAVYTMMPPSMGPGNMIENIAAAGQAYADAIKAANVKRVVMLSSVGADAPAGTGPVGGVHRVEQIFQDQLTDVNVTIVRSGFFYVNFFRDIPLIKNRGIFGNNYGGDDRLALTHHDDLSTAIAAELQAKGNGFEIKYVISDISTGNQLAALFGQAIGKPELTWTEILDEQLKQGMLGAGLPAELAGLITELGQGVRAGIVMKDFFAKGGAVTGKIKLEQFAEDFKNRYQQA